MMPQREHIYLAALLHDIGKFYQRADKNNAAQSSRLNQEVKEKLPSVLCPSQKSYGYSHKHVLWTAQFFYDFEQQIRGLMPGQSDLSFDSLMRLSAAHHNPLPDNLSERIVQKADHYSSGADRSVIEDAWKDAEEESRWDSFRLTRMRSVFEGVSQAEYKHKLPLMEITLDRSFFPFDQQADAPDYEALWDSFVREVRFIQTHSFATFSETLLALLEKYTSRIPSSTVHLPDVSLYDHLKTTAAFAVGLHDYITEKGLSGLPGKEEKPFLLVGGDLSGIQKFIYNIIPRGAAKNLKGRSFYLQLLVNNIIIRIQEKLGLYNASVLYASGGGFYLIAPNTPRVREGIKELDGEIAALLFNRHRTDLYLGLATVEFGEAELFSQQLGDLWFRLSEELSERKGRRFSGQIKNSYATLFEDSGESGGNKPKDAITGEELRENYRDLDQYKVNFDTWQQVELGKKLKQTDYWILSREKLTYFSDEPFSPAGLPYYNYFVTNAYIREKEQQLRGSADRVRALRVNQPNFLETAQKGIENIYGFTFYGGNEYPEDPWGAPQTFEELAGIEFSDPEKTARAKTPGLSRIGILRMDVDRLGFIFKTAFRPERRSFSRYSTLSRSLDYFFTGHINTIWKGKEEYSRYTQVIYSGGDDLFLVGKWDVLIRMAAEIRQAFREWTCHTKAFSISGGIAVVPPRFPLLKAAAYAEEAEKKAKGHRYGDEDKNAFHLLGYSLNWDSEFSYVQRLKNQLKDMLEAQAIPAGFVSTVYGLMQQARFSGENQKVGNYQVVWLAAYQFKRAMKGEKNEEVKSFYAAWINNIFTGKLLELPGTPYHPLQLLALAARWAALEIRTEKRSATS